MVDSRDLRDHFPPRRRSTRSRSNAPRHPPRRGSISSQSRASVFPQRLDDLRELRAVLSGEYEPIVVALPSGQRVRIHFHAPPQMATRRPRWARRFCATQVARSPPPRHSPWRRRRRRRTWHPRRVTPTSVPPSSYAPRPSSRPETRRATRVGGAADGDDLGGADGARELARGEAGGAARADDEDFPAGSEFTVLEERLVAREVRGRERGSVREVQAGRDERELGGVRDGQLAARAGRMREDGVARLERVDAVAHSAPRPPRTSRPAMGPNSRGRPNLVVHRMPPLAAFTRIVTCPTPGGLGSA